MESRCANALGALLLAVPAVLTAACTSSAGADGGSAPVTTAPAASEAAPTGETEPGLVLPDITSRPIALSDLEAMLPTGESRPESTGTRSTVPRSNADLITGAVLDRADEAADIDRYGRITGASASYPIASGTAHIWIDLFPTTDDAAGWVTDTAGDIVKRAGGSHRPDVRVASAEEYPAEQGEGAIGLVLSLEGGGTETAVLLHAGRIAVFASVVGESEGDHRVAVGYLAEETLRRVVAVLTGLDPDPIVSTGPATYEFSYEQIIVIGGRQWSAKAEGTYDRGAVACSVEADLPGLQSDADLVGVPGRLWVGESGSSLAPRNPAGAVDARLLALCPAWPLDPGALGLGEAYAGEPAHHEIGGIPAIGYSGTAGQLELAFGLEPATASISAFNIWVAEETGWVIELDLTVTGDPSLLAQLIGTGFPGGESATISISQRITAIDDAGPVIPPG